MGAGVVTISTCRICGVYVADEVRHRAYHAEEEQARDDTLAVLRPLVSDLESRARDASS